MQDSIIENNKDDDLKSVDSLEFRVITSERWIDLSYKDETIKNIVSHFAEIFYIRDKNHYNNYIQSKLISINLPDVFCDGNYGGRYITSDNAILSIRKILLFFECVTTIIYNDWFTDNNKYLTTKFINVMVLKIQEFMNMFEKEKKYCGGEQFICSELHHEMTKIYNNKLENY